MGQALSAVVLRYLALCALLAALAPGCGGGGLGPSGTGGTGGSDPSATGGSGGGTGGTFDAGGDGSLCPNYFSPQPDGSPTLGPCCPVPTPDCSGIPDGAAPVVPGLKSPDGSAVNVCTPRDAPFCSCNCQGGQWQCGC